MCNDFNYEKWSNEKEMKSLRKEIACISDEINNLHCEKDEIGGEICNLKHKRKDLQESLELLEKERKEWQAEVDDVKCSLKCPYRKDPSKCQKTDQSRCPFRSTTIQITKYGGVNEIES